MKVFHLKVVYWLQTYSQELWLRFGDWEGRIYKWSASTHEVTDVVSVLGRLVVMGSWKVHICMKENSREILIQWKYQWMLWFPKEKTLIFFPVCNGNFKSDRRVPIKILSQTRKSHYKLLFLLLRNWIFIRVEYKLFLFAYLSFLMQIRIFLF